MYRSYSAHRDRDKMLVTAIWLMALGSVFLIQQFSGWGWDRAWPLFVIFLGVGAGASALFDRRGWRLGLWAISWPMLMVIGGTVLLLSTTGSISFPTAELWTLWPVAIVALGLWFVVGAFLVPRSSGPESVSVPLDGATAADVQVRFGGGELTIQPAQPGKLVDGQFDGGIEMHSGGPGRVRLEPVHGTWPLWWNQPLHWSLGLTAEVPVDLRVDTGASRSAIDLSGLRIRTLRLKTGASDTRVTLPRAGVTQMLAESGVASLTIEVPQGVAARIRSRSALGTLSIDEHRFPPVFDGYISPDYDTATNRVDIDIRSGIGAVRIV